MRSRKNDFVYTAQKTSDGGFVLGGATDPLDGSPTHDWLLKLEGDGRIAWQKSLGITATHSIRQTGNGDLLLAGNFWNAGTSGTSAWLARLSGAGDVIWQKQMPGMAVSQLQGLIFQETLDGGGLFVGHSTDFITILSSTPWVIKVDDAGNVLWYKTLGNGILRTMQITADGGYVLAGQGGAFSNPVPRVVRLNSDGSVAWDKSYGSATGQFQVIQTMPDGNFLIAGSNKEFSYGDEDFWLLKLAGDGSILWQGSYGDMGPDVAMDIQNTSDGGYVVVGSRDGDIWLIKFRFGIPWSKSFGGPGLERGIAVQELANGDLLMVGETESFGTGGRDIWIWRLTSNADVTNCSLINHDTALAFTDSTVTAEDMTNFYGSGSSPLADASFAAHPLFFQTATMCRVGQ